MIPFFQRPRAGETKWEVPAITSGTPQSRSFSRLQVPHKYRTKLKVDNHRGNATLTLTVNGETRSIGPGTVVGFGADEVGNIVSYTLDADADVAADTVVVYENGGLSHAD